MKLIKLVIVYMMIIAFTVQSIKKNDMSRTEANTNRKNKMKHNIDEKYTYPKKEADTSDKYTVALLGTNDMHGNALSKIYKYTKHGKVIEYQAGGFEYLASYLEILRKDWGNRLLWLDGGDLWSGGFESRVTKGKIIMDSLAALGVGATTVGNHEFNEGYDLAGEIKNNNEQNRFPFITANVKKDEKELCTS
jgi:2',3'-cyclic-nucleotide 2'-phosphodiesterase (5'-nucleotidase family)